MFHRTASLNADQARKLLATFRNPVRAEVEQSGLSGQFISTDRFMEAAYVSGGYITTSEGISDVTIGQEGIYGMDDATDLLYHGYSFAADRLHNWHEAVKATRDHLKELASQDSAQA